jgi:molecular chaperone GrpE
LSIDNRGRRETAAEKSKENPMVEKARPDLPLSVAEEQGVCTACKIAAALEETLVTLSGAQRTLDEQRGRIAELENDFANYTRRHEKDRHIQSRRANEELLKALLPVLDNFGIALKMAASGETSPAIVMGMHLILKKLQSILSGFGLQVYHTQNDPFDPALHEAVQIVERNDVAPNIVIEEIQAGYTFDGHIIRHAKVVVSTLPERPGTCQAEACSPESA